MKKTASTALLTALAMCASSLIAPAHAGPLTIACVLRSTTTQATRFIEADQFLFDLNSQSVDMRSAKTIGTENPVNWVFSNRTDLFGEDHFTLSRREAEIVGAGIYGSNPVAIRLGSNGILTWVFIDLEGTPQVMRWQCHL